MGVAGNRKHGNVEFVTTRTDLFPFFVTATHVVLLEI